ncbi:MAG: nucleotidyltransferase domain-containing protein [Chloroflexota bacterium]|nr:MAG: nucleotidyltransferase domain-containing protein [Chloroflexota bacterium]
MTAVERDVLEKFKSLLSKRVKPHSLVVFGSRARGDATLYSDMDVLVVVDRLDEEIRGYISDSAWEAGFDHGIVVVPVAFTREEWEDGPERSSLLAEAVRSEGISL